MLIKRGWLFETVLPSDPDEIFSSPRRSFHRIELEHNYWTTRRTLWLDGRRLASSDLRSYAIYGMGSDDMFFTDSSVCLIRARPNGLTYRYDFSINGVSTDDGKFIKPWSETWQAGSQTRIPLWAWLLMVLVPVLPAVVYGWLIQVFVRPEQLQDLFVAHLIPGIIIGSAATTAVYRIVRIARNSTLSLLNRVLRCVLALSLATVLADLLCFICILVFFA